MSSLVVALFLTIFSLVILVVGLGVRYLEQQRKAQVAGMFKDPATEPELRETTVLIERPGEESSPMTRLLSLFDFPKKWEVQLQQAGLNWTVPQLLFAMAVAAVFGALFGTLVPVFVYPGLSVVGLACVFALLPWLFVRHKQKRRLAAFEEQFPEALDFMARAMRAGHAFPVSLSMLSQESPEPLKAEFLKVYNEQNLGESIPVVLRHLADRVPLVDVRFFVSAVLMQRETGGNLGEILTKLAFVIRERFRLKGQVRAASAHGRITATILTVLPIVTVLALTVIAPGYLPALAQDPDGKYLILAAILGQVTGYLIMRKIIDIKV